MISVDSSAVGNNNKQLLRSRARVNVCRATHYNVKNYRKLPDVNESLSECHYKNYFYYNIIYKLVLIVMPWRA
jgi:hypothetical protein